MGVTTEDLRRVLQNHEAVVEQALEHLFPDPAAPMNLDALRVLTGAGGDLADVLFQVLSWANQTAKMNAFFMARSIQLDSSIDLSEWSRQNTRRADVEIPEPAQTDFPMNKLGDFSLRASAFRCQIVVGGAPSGSGAFISKRLVLTAAHVIQDFLNAKEDQDGGDAGIDLPKITIVASDGDPVNARYVWHSQVHANERTGALPPPEAQLTHRDLALLRVDLPIGLSYGFCDVLKQPVNWNGSRLMTLVHYPEGEETGFTSGYVLRETDTDIRLRHNLRTRGGSSGGLAFDRELDFIGIHQGRWNDNKGKLIPHHLFANDPKFIETIEHDQPHTYLWSLEDDINGQIIIGRQSFFKGLAYMLEKPASMLRGLWIRRLDTSTTTGLNFSFEMLKAFLNNRRLAEDVQTRHKCFRIPTDLGGSDLISALAEQVLGTGLDTAIIEALPGVRTGETGNIAKEHDRAMRLAHAIAQRAKQDQATYWLFFITPPYDALSDAVRTQLEHLSQSLLAHGEIRLVLAGFEQYALAERPFQHPEDADTSRQPGLLADTLGRFTKEDVQVTLQAMLEDLNNEENLNPLILQDMVDTVVQGFAEVQPDMFKFEDIGKAAKRIRNTVIARLGLV